MIAQLYKKVKFVVNIVQAKSAMNKKRDTSIAYLLLGIYALMVNWYYNHSIILLIFAYIFWPFYLVYELLSGHLSHDMWKIIPLSYFK